MENCTLFGPSTKNKKNLSQESSLYFRKMELFSSNIKKILYSLKRKLFLYFGKRKPEKNSLYFRKRNFLKFQEPEILKNFLNFQKWNFQNLKSKKNPLLKSFLYFGKWNFLALRLRNSLYFPVSALRKTFLIFQETKISYILEN